MNFNVYPRADSISLENDHDIYRVWEIPSRRDSDYYDGSGIVKTYNMAAVDDKDFPDDEDACPSLNKIKVGTIDKSIMRKNVSSSTTTCPDCEIDARKNPRSGETFCPECGLVFDDQPLEYDANAAERYPNE